MPIMVSQARTRCERVRIVAHQVAPNPDRNAYSPT